MKQLIKDFLRTLILVTPFKLLQLAIIHISLHPSGDVCLWDLIIAIIILPLIVIVLIDIEVIFKIYIKPLWEWVWDDED